MHIRSISARVLVAGALLSALTMVAPPASARQDTKYLVPPKVIVDLLDAKPLPTVSVSPTNTQVAMLQRASMPPISELAAPMLRLAGTRINPKTNGPQRGGGILAITLKQIADGKETKVTTPLKPNITWIGFAPDGRRFAFLQTAASGIELWVGNAATGAAKALTTPTLNATMGSACSWASDRELLVPVRGGRPRSGTEGA